MKWFNLIFLLFLLSCKTGAKSNEYEINQLKMVVVFRGSPSVAYLEYIPQRREVIITYSDERAIFFNGKLAINVQKAKRIDEVVKRVVNSKKSVYKKGKLETVSLYAMLRIYTSEGEKLVSSWCDIAFKENEVGKDMSLLVNLLVNESINQICENHLGLWGQGTSAEVITPKEEICKKQLEALDYISKKVTDMVELSKKTKKHEFFLYYSITSNLMIQRIFILDSLDYFEKIKFSGDGGIIK